jgi:hypothetical protein
VKPLDRALLIFSAVVLTGAFAGHAIVSSRSDSRRLVLDCMTEIGWETAADDVPMAQALEQSRDWCEDFMRGEREKLED